MSDRFCKWAENRKKAVQCLDNGSVSQQMSSSAVALVLKDLNCGMAVIGAGHFPHNCRVLPYFRDIYCVKWPRQKPR